MPMASAAQPVNVVSTVAQELDAYLADHPMDAVALSLRSIILQRDVTVAGRDRRTERRDHEFFDVPVDAAPARAHRRKTWSCHGRAGRSANRIPTSAFSPTSRCGD